MKEIGLGPIKENVSVFYVMGIILICDMTHIDFTKGQKSRNVSLKLLGLTERINRKDTQKLLFFFMTDKMDELYFHLEF